LNYKTFFTWLLVSVYQGGVIMILCIYLFNDEFIRVVTITFTALILNELLMVALEISTWHYLMILAEFLSLISYAASFWILKNELEVPQSRLVVFLLHIGLITLVSFLPLCILKLANHFLAPPSYTKLSS
jgi:phospholipid-translocating ATPase